MTEQELSKIEEHYRYLSSGDARTIMDLAGTIRLALQRAEENGREHAELVVKWAETDVELEEARRGRDEARAKATGLEARLAGYAEGACGELSRRIMNLSDNAPMLSRQTGVEHAYEMGHRDARNAAAELVSSAGRDAGGEAGTGGGK